VIAQALRLSGATLNVFGIDVAVWPGSLIDADGRPSDTSAVDDKI
jgi:hypothetical protein